MFRAGRLLSTGLWIQQRCRSCWLLFLATLIRSTFGFGEGRAPYRCWRSLFQSELRRLWWFCFRSRLRRWSLHKTGGISTYAARDGCWGRRLWVFPWYSAADEQSSALVCRAVDAGGGALLPDLAAGGDSCDFSRKSRQSSPTGECLSQIYSLLYSLRPGGCRVDSADPGNSPDVKRTA
jgi:hypothetical protein